MTAIQSDLWLVGGGEMGALIRSLDWSTSPIGPIDTWPQSLRTALGICLSSRFPMAIWWGPTVLQFYNDGYRPFLGAKHPRSMGQRGDECWAEIWDVCGPLYRHVMSTGESTWSADLQLLMERNGYLEETYFTFSYSPIRGEAAEVLGNLITVTETTERVIGERRLRTLRDIGALAMTGRTPDEAAQLATRTLATNAADVPFSLLYAVDGGQARLVATSGLGAGTPASPVAVTLRAGAGVWPLAQVVASAQPAVIGDLAHLDGLPSEPWKEAPHTAIALPLVSAEAVTGVLVAAVSPRRTLDDASRSFYDVLASQIATVLANARAHEEQRARAEALAALDRAKTEFFSNVSHEFRTPLTLMLGSLDDALRSSDIPAAEQELLRVAHRNSLRLLKLVNTLLDFSRIEAGRTDAAYQPLDLPRITADFAASFRAAVERAGLRLVVDCPPLDEPVWVDREMWEKIVLNLLSNAFKFTFEGEIAVRVRGAGGDAVLEIADTGIGIAADDLPHVFERFHRVRGARSRTHEGSGIGLALVQELVKLHGGHIGAASRPGAGTTFTVTIPRGTAHLPADRQGAPRTRVSTAIAAEAFIEEALRWLPDEALPTVELPARPATAGARVLVADDNADMREYIRRLLALHWSVELASDGEEALARARERPPDLVLSDVMMPRRDGYQLLRALRENPRTATIPVVLLSARAGEEARVDGLDAGADDYLVKPFAARELVARVHAHLTLARQRRETEQQLQEFFEDSVVAMHWAGPDGTVLRANRAELELLGYASEEYVGRNVADFHEDAAAIAAITERLGRGEAIRDQPARLRAKDGSVKHVLISSNVRWADGRFVHTRCFTRDVTELRRVEEERDRLLAAEQAARRVAESGSRAKDEFLAMLAHELRNPLGVALNGVMLLDHVGSQNAEAMRIRQLMSRQIEHLSRLLDDLLDVARIGQGKIELRREPLDVRATVDFAVESERHRIAAKDQILEVAMPAEPVTVYGDAARLQQVVANLLHNASKYTPARGRISVSVHQRDHEAVVQVRDTGIGIPREKLASVFDLFVQLDPSLERSQGGLGIGLTLVRRLAEQHGGRVEARSEGPGRGSEFSVILPLSQATRPARRASLTLTHRPPLEILLIEDNADAREMLEFGLEQAGHHVESVGDGPAGIAMATARRPDVAIVDIGLPGMDGFAVARALRAKFGAELRMVALTGYGQSSDRQRTLEAGFDAHVTKPATVEDVLAALER